MVFPTSPSNGQQITVANITYEYNSTKAAWYRVISVSNGNIGISVGNVVTGNIYAGSYYWANGTPVSFGTGGGVDLTTYTGNISGGNITITGNSRSGNVITSGFYWANGTPVSFGTGGGGSAITVQDEGNTITSSATSFNFVGSGVTATNVGSNVTVTITGGGGGSFSYTASTTPPASGNVTGDQWFNTSSNVLYEYLYDGTSYFWVDINTSTGTTTTGYVSRKYTTDGVTAGYTVSSGCNIFNVMVYLNGIAQTPSDDYTISGSTLTFAETPATGQILQIRELPR